MFVPESISFDEAKRVLFPLFRREYLGIGESPIDSHLLSAVASRLMRFRGNEEEVSEFVFGKMKEWDGLGDERSLELWTGIGKLRDADELAAFAITAKVPQNAAEAFYAYPQTPAGQQKVVKAPGGWQEHFDNYLHAAFDRKDKAPDYLRAMVRRSLLFALNEGSVTLTVTAEQKRIFDEAWKDVPEALKHVQVKEEPKGEEQKK